MRARGADEWLVEVPCSECGARDFEVTRPGWVEGVGDWLRFGGRWRPPRRVCRRCGDAASDARSHAALRAPRWGWWSVPFRLVQALRRHRAMVPVPATYLVAALVGVVVGLAAQLVLGWPWWLLAAAVVAAVWLLFAATALWGAGPGPSLATDLLRVVRPRRAIERAHRQEVERFRAAPFPLYGLPPAWPGPRHLGGWEGSWARGERPVTTALGLAHGDPLAGQGPQLRVEVRAGQVDIGQVTTVEAERQRDLAEELWLQAPPQARDLAGHLEQLAAARRRPDPDWSGVTIPVDGRPVGFAWLAEGRHWVARAELDGRTLTLHARDLPIGSVELVQVIDLAPYVQGQRRLQEAWLRHHDEQP